MPITVTSQFSFSRTDCIFLLFVAIYTALFVEWELAGKTIYGINFLAQDEGVGFLVNDVLLRGGTLYKDIAYPYGYIPAYLHAAAAKIFGNTISTYLHVLLAIDVLAHGLFYILLRKVLRPAFAFFYTIIVVFPDAIAPGGIMDNGISNMAYPLEKIPLLIAALLWSAPRRRLPWRAGLVGCCLGVMQGIKFGTGIVAALALVLVEIMVWYRSRQQAGAGGSAVRDVLFIGSGFLLIQGVWIAVACVSLPRGLVLDVLWPSYMRVNYNSVVAEAYFPWRGVGYFITVYMVPCMGILGLLWWAGSTFLVPRVHRRAGSTPSLTRESDALEDNGGLVVLFIFFLLASFVLFKGRWHFAAFAWIPVLGGAYLLLRPSQVVRWTFVLLCCIGFLRFLNIKKIEHSDLPLVPLKLDDGEQLWVSETRRRDLTALVTYLRAPAPGQRDETTRPVVFYPLGAGFHVFFHLPRQGRNSWYGPGLVRPYDVADIKALASAARWVILPLTRTEQLTADPTDWDRLYARRIFTFDDFLREEIKTKLRLDHSIDGTYWIFSSPP